MTPWDLKTCSQLLVWSITRVCGDVYPVSTYYCPFDAHGQKKNLLWRWITLYRHRFPLQLWRRAVLIDPGPSPLVVLHRGSRSTIPHYSEQVSYLLDNSFILTAMPRLRVLAGPSPSSLVPISDIVNTDKPHTISSDYFAGQVVVNVKGFTDLHGRVLDSEYFHRPDRKDITWSLQVQGTWWLVYLPCAGN